MVDDVARRDAGPRGEDPHLCRGLRRRQTGFDAHHLLDGGFAALAAQSRPVGAQGAAYYSDPEIYDAAVDNSANHTID